MTADAVPENERATRDHDRIRELEAQVDNLTAALRTRGDIGQAVGITMAVRQCDAEQALDILKSASQHTNTKVHDIAAALAQSVKAPVPVDASRSIRHALHIVLRTPQLNPVQHPAPAGVPDPRTARRTAPVDEESRAHW
ncbi:ANTAR domain-containing protein [Nocardiopsis ansamitocini]|uniref:ANTAR domain-containing protein n=1 Tax=Nocardiopsis ansamitocini TaxID=1670832 RepID=A0A9W6PAR4_9ACTN|nr:ANTAR domain-containing protein [Nocardiopsis ansamitocini]GLU50250.1 hypothetical protein Nans01_46010 [Nocardiopsis ansamitocini]